MKDEGRLSRRDLVVALGGTLALSACGGSGGGMFGASSQIALGTAIAGDTKTEIDTWTKLAGTTFSAGNYALTLVGVEAIAAEGKRPADTRAQPFIATFDIVQGGIMPTEGLYRLTSSAVQPFDVTLTSGTMAPTRAQALFN